LADPIAAHVGTAPTVVDVGGGWHVDDAPVLRDCLDYLIAEGPAALREGNARLVLEPGKFLTEPAGALIARVIGYGGGNGEGDRDVVVDAAIAELPEARYRAHPVAHFRAPEWRPLPSGKGRILGRSCMEGDILGQRLELSGVQIGEYLAFGSCGAYDLAMSYLFGRGAVSGCDKREL
jgi:diaminopimelate decarboxylase